MMPEVPSVEVVCQQAYPGCPAQGAPFFGFATLCDDPPRHSICDTLPVGLTCVHLGDLALDNGRFECLFDAAGPDPPSNEVYYYHFTCET